MDCFAQSSQGQNFDCSAHICICGAHELCMSWQRCLKCGMFVCVFDLLFFLNFLLFQKNILNTQTNEYVKLLPCVM